MSDGRCFVDVWVMSDGEKEVGDGKCVVGDK